MYSDFKYITYMHSNFFILYLVNKASLTSTHEEDIEFLNKNFGPIIKICSCHYLHYVFAHLIYILVTFSLIVYSNENMCKIHINCMCFWKINFRPFFKKKTVWGCYLFILGSFYIRLLPNWMHMQLRHYFSQCDNLWFVVLLLTNKC